MAKFDTSKFQCVGDFTARMLLEFEGYEQVLGVMLDRSYRTWTLTCPLPHHQDNRPSFSIYIGNQDGALLWKCWGCGCTGTLAKLAELLQVQLPRGLVPFPTVTTTTHQVPDIKQDPQVYVAWASARLLNAPDVLSWLSDGRCISLETVQQMQLGLDELGRVIFPSYDAQGQLCAVDAHGWKPKSHYTLLGERALFGMDAIQAAKQLRMPILLCEGEPDCAAARSAGWHAVSVPGAAIWKDQWADYFYGVDILLAFDHDVDGHRASCGVAEVLYGVASSVRILLWPDHRPQGHDVTDELRREGAKSLERLARNALPYTPPVQTVGRRIDWLKVDHARVPLALLMDTRLLPIDTKVYAALQSFGSGGYPRYEDIAQMVSFSRKSVIESVQRLESAGWVKVRRGWYRGKCSRNSYYVQPSCPIP